MNVLYNLRDFFLGTTRRVGWTLAGAIVMYFMAYPQELRNILTAGYNNIVVPVVNALLPLFIIYLVFIFLLRKAKGGGKK